MHIKPKHIYELRYLFIGDNKMGIESKVFIIADYKLFDQNEALKPGKPEKYKDFLNRLHNQKQKESLREPAIWEANIYRDISIVYFIN
jgi:hypothetical protein